MLAGTAWAQQAATASDTSSAAAPAAKNHSQKRADAVEQRISDLHAQLKITDAQSTQWDAFSHVGRHFDADGDGTPEMIYYNGFRAGEDVIGANVPGGPTAKRLGIEKMAETCVQGRGVLLDLNHYFGAERRLVNFDDLLILAKNYNKTGMTRAQGDFTGDGVVNFDDLLVLAKNYNQSLAPPAGAEVVLASVAPASAAVTGQSSVLKDRSASAKVFSTTRVVKPAPVKTKAVVHPGSKKHR